MQHLPTSGVPSDDTLGVIAWRLGTLEEIVSKIDGKFDSVANLYVNQASLMLILNPIKEDVRELQHYNKEKEKEKNQRDGQMKLVLIGAAASPVVSAIVAMFVAGR